MRNLFCSEQPVLACCAKLHAGFSSVVNSVMLHLLNVDRTYSPETIAVMTAAFEKVCNSVLPGMCDDDDQKRKLALIILRHVDRGERDAQRLADVALQEWTGSDRSQTIVPFARANRDSPK